MTKKVFLAAILTALAFYPINSAAASELTEGVRLYNSGEYMKARHHFENAAKESPRSWQARYYLAITSLAVGQKAEARYHYQLCLKTCNDPVLSARCRAGIAQTGGSTGRSRPAPARTHATFHVTKTEPAAQSQLSSSSKDSEIAIHKAQIMDQARRDVEKAKEEGKQQLDSEKTNANQWWRYEDGSIGTDISNEREAEIQHETEERVRKIMDNAERRANSVH